jgi:low affinity Fe/Cu permease
MRMLGRMTDAFRKFASKVAEHVGSPGAFFVATGVILTWALTGPLFGFSDTWQLVINTGTTIVTFLMVFLIQSTQNRDARAIHLKLDELIRSQKRARDVFADLEDATEEELKSFQEEFKRLRHKGLQREDAAAGAAEKARHH